MAKKNYGPCNICTKRCKLTYDHVPPRGSLDPQRVWVDRVTSLLSQPDPRVRRISQNGLKFRTLCNECNSLLLGSRYDPDLNYFSRKVAQVLRAAQRLHLPDRVPIACRTQRVARAVIGHLLAAEIRPDMDLPPTQAPVQNAMRMYFLDPMAEMPDGFHLIWWPYPARRQIVLRGVGVLAGFLTTRSSTFLGDFLKYFPVAFWLVDNTRADSRALLTDRRLDMRMCALNEQREVMVPTRARDTFRPDWPERPSDDEVLIINDSRCVYAEPFPMAPQGICRSDL